MLVLSRRIGESVIIADNVTVTVLEVRGDVVRIGIDAPRSVGIIRAELLDEVESSNKDAATPDSSTLESLRDAIGHKNAARRPKDD